MITTDVWNDWRAGGSESREQRFREGRGGTTGVHKGWRLQMAFVGTQSREALLWKKKKILKPQARVIVAPSLRRLRHVSSTEYRRRYCLFACQFGCLFFKMGVLTCCVVSPPFSSRHCIFPFFHHDDDEDAGSNSDPSRHLGRGSSLCSLSTPATQSNTSL